jgi:hypothetical protein
MLAEHGNDTLSVIGGLFCRLGHKHVAQMPKMRRLKAGESLCAQETVFAPPQLVSTSQPTEQTPFYNLHQHQVGNSGDREECEISYWQRHEAQSRR